VHSALCAPAMGRGGPGAGQLQVLILAVLASHVLGEYQAYSYDRNLPLELMEQDSGAFQRAPASSWAKRFGATRLRSAQAPSPIKASDTRMWVHLVLVLWDVF
jgi:hypothetical protein